MRGGGRRFAGATGTGVFGAGAGLGGVFVVGTGAAGACTAGVGAGTGVTDVGSVPWASGVVSFGFLSLFCPWWWSPFSFLAVPSWMLRLVLVLRMAGFLF